VDVARFDLNLISALNALLSERNVTRAAERLNVTQPTMSGMLQRLRAQFDDELLVRNGREMELTPFAASLLEPVREALRGVELLLQAEPVFDPATSTREFALMASDYCTAIFLPGVIRHLAAEAPGVRLTIQPINMPVDRMTAGDIDLCITADDLSLLGHDQGPEKLHAEHLFSDEFVCVVAKDHPLTEDADLAELLSYPHVGVQMVGTVQTIETASLRRYAPHYRPNYMVADFSLVASLVAHSNLVGVIQARLAQDAARSLPIRTFRPPFEMPSLNEAMLWHSRHLEDPAHVWLRGVLRDAAEVWRAEPPSASPARAAEMTPRRRRATIHAVR